jgi:hypothetical protein
MGEKHGNFLILTSKLTSLHTGVLMFSYWSRINNVKVPIVPAAISLAPLA